VLPVGAGREVRFFGQSATPQGLELETAAWCVESLAEWDECLLWITQTGVWPSSENWPRFYEARGVEGELRSLKVAPGHLFNSSERDKLAQFVRLTLENAWDGAVLPALQGVRTPRFAIVSHDEWVELVVSKPEAA